MKYKIKHETIDAVPFLYTKIFIKKLQEFVYPLELTVMKERHPSAIARAILTLANDFTLYIDETDYVIKDKTHGFRIMGSKEFNKHYELESEDE